MSLRFLLPSAVLLLVLLSQVAVTLAGAVVKWKHGSFEDHYWPFLDYPMYSEAYGPPVQTSTVTLSATLPDGRVLPIDAAYLGLDYFGWRYHIVERLVAEPPTGRHAHLAVTVEEHREEAFRRVVTQVRQLTAEWPTQLTVLRTVYTIEDGELVEAEVTRTVEVDPDEVAGFESEAANAGPSDVSEGGTP